jgi:hypothetical protein
LVEEVSELLNISNDSAYRRIRGEKPISLDELQVLCQQYSISIDQLLKLRSDTFIFSGNLVDNGTFGLEQYLRDMARTLEMFKTLPNPHMHFFMKDIPPFYYMGFSELRAFKFFFWKRTLLGYPELAKQRFNGIEENRELIESAKKIYDLYATVPTTEIWNDVSVNATITQIEFYRQSNTFENKDIIWGIYSQLEELLNHLESQAEVGKKFPYGQTSLPTSVPYNIYINECLIGDNTTFVQGGDIRMTFLNHNGLNFAGTTDKTFNDYTYRHLQNTISKSTLISLVGEKERTMFFNMLRDKIRERKNSI